MVNYVLIVVSYGGMLFCLLFLVISIFIGYFRIQAYQCRQRLRYGQQQNKSNIVFFHPYCSAGGGGERVLWKMIEVLSNLVTTKGMTTIGTVIIYTIDPPSDEYKVKLLKDVQQRFNFNISDTFQLSFIHLPQYRYLLEPASSFSLLLESVGAMKLAYIALRESLTTMQIVPDVFIDTMGCSFTYLPASILFGSAVIPYVHYPTISTDMLNLVWERRPTGSYNHDSSISQSAIKTYGKLLYYVLFALAYGCIGSFCCTIVLVNSTWTYNHIVSLWKFAKNKTRIVYPPCNVTDLIRARNECQPEHQQQQQRVPAIVSIGQFRPEKDHALQLQAFADLLDMHPTLYRRLHEHDSTNNQTATTTTVQLVLIGSCRGKDDEIRLQSLKELAIKLNVQDYVEFVVNQPYSVLQEWLQNGTIGIHTMWNEHFGIGIVEMMAAGLVTIAHNSGGPKLDIITPRKTGYLATTSTEYANCIHEAFQMSEQDKDDMRKHAQESVSRFSDEMFAKEFEKLIILDLLL